MVQLMMMDIEEENNVADKPVAIVMESSSSSSLSSTDQISRSISLRHRAALSLRSQSFNAVIIRDCMMMREQSSSTNDNDDEVQLQWAAIEKLPSIKRLRTSLDLSFNRHHHMTNGGNYGESDEEPKMNNIIINNISKLGASSLESQVYIDKLIKHVEEDNRRLLEHLKERMDKVGIKLPTVEVRYKNLCVEAECKVVHHKSMPSLWNSVKGMFYVIAKIPSCSSQKAKLSILQGVSGIIKPSRMTLLLGPPGSGKTTFLKALAGKLDQSLKVSGEISYNGYSLESFVPQKTAAAYISQYDLHIPEMTVRETLDFSARCQGFGGRTEFMMEMNRREMEAGTVAQPELDIFMKVRIMHHLQNGQCGFTTIWTILGLDICADTMVGDTMRRGISRGQKRILTTGKSRNIMQFLVFQRCECQLCCFLTGEMMVGPRKALFMDEISTGLDSSTTFQIVSCIQQLVNITDGTALVSLLQPAPETFDLFDDIILFAEGKVLYHGPRNHILKFLEDCGFKCPKTKGVADFLQEVVSRKDQSQYWYYTEQPYSYVSVDQFSEKFKAYHLGQKIEEELSKPCEKFQTQKDALSFTNNSKTKWELFKTCMGRELLLTKRNSIASVFRLAQLVIIAFIMMSVFLSKRMKMDVVDADHHMGALFYALTRFAIGSTAELPATASRLSVFYKERNFKFYPPWAYSIPTYLAKVPFSLVECLIWTSLTYHGIGYSPEVQKFFYQFLLFFALQQAITSLFRFIASVCQTDVAATTSASLSLLMMLLYGGFIIPQPSLPASMRWGFWVSPMSYAEIGLSVNEFLAPRWQKVISGNSTTAQEALTRHGLNFDRYFYWISLGALFGFTILFNIGFTLALTYGKSPGVSRRVIVSHEKFYQRKNEDSNIGKHESIKPNSSAPPTTCTKTGRTEKMVLPFEPLAITFQDVQYFIDTPLEMRKQGVTETRLQLLSDITGEFRPGVLTALMGINGSGKTTLMDVFSGRKTNGFIEGEIRVGGYPKVQKTFSRISAYCEQFDIHTPQITVEESVAFSAWLRLPSEIDSNTKAEFVKEVLHTIELDGLKDVLVGIPGVSGLSNEQRKRLTIAVELASNPSIIFMDEPTSGLDAKAASTVMRAVNNIVNTGRTVVCTIHQPSLDIFEAFDELILMKKGGQIIYSGPLGHHSSNLIEYFEGIPGLPKMKENYNPATWMLEVTNESFEEKLGIDFAQLYKEELYFRNRFSCNGWDQFKACLWKQHLSSWRSPKHRLLRFMCVTFSSLLLGRLLWQKGKKINNEQDLFNIIRSMFIVLQIVGINDCSSVLPIMATERTVLYREKFARMYSSWAYSFAKVIIEIPYILLEAVIFVGITYPAIGYYWSVYKVFWYFYATFCKLLYFNYLGMLLVSLSPNVGVAAILANGCYSILNLFSGFVIPGPDIPKWWLWFYVISPTSWSLNALINSQYGDINNEILAFGKPKAINAFLKDYFGYHHDKLGFVAIVLAIYPLVFAYLFALFIGKLNFQRIEMNKMTADALKIEIDDDDISEDEVELQWAAIERLPTFERLRTSLVLDENGDDYHDVEAMKARKKQRVVDVTSLKALERKLFIDRLINHVEEDNRRLLQKIKERLDKADVELPKVEMRYKNLCVDAVCETVQGKALPTLWNSFKNLFSVFTKIYGCETQETKISILKDANGVIKPSRMTLLLGPPGCGKTTFLLALAGKLNQNKSITGEISYNGYKLEEFIPQETSAYISQYNLHIPEMTVRETLDFSAHCQGVGSRTGMMTEVIRKEKQAGTVPESDIDIYMKAISIEGLERTLQTDYILKILGLDVCADTLVGDALRRGISGGQKKRLTTGEMIVGPKKAFLMDEISTGLDSSTTFQVVSCIQQFVHITDATVVVSLLQPASETFDLFDDIILMAEGKIVYHGPRSHVLEFFEHCGFRCPERKGVADFLQEVISERDQEQYWYHTEQSYSYVTVDQLLKNFKEYSIGQKLDEELSEPYEKSQCHKNAISFSIHSMSKWELFRACFARELLLMKRNLFLYLFKFAQLSIIALITMTLFLRTRMEVDALHADYYIGSLLNALIRIVTNGIPELSMTFSRLPVFYKQRNVYFYPAWAYTIPAVILKLPLSLVESFMWTALTYYGIGYSPEFERFCRHFLILFALHQTTTSLFRFLASVYQIGDSLPAWLNWGFWLSPMTHGAIGLSGNEFLAPRWQKVTFENTTIGHETLTSHGLDFAGYFYWISLGALFAFTLLFNIGFTLALTYSRPAQMPRVLISHEKISQLPGREDCGSNEHLNNKLDSTISTISDGEARKTGKMILPFEPIAMTFRDLHYFVDTPKEMRKKGFPLAKLQLLGGITGTFRPGALTALMGVTGAGKTTLLDVLSGRKTTGIIKGDIRIGGYPKVQETFARISGYCEQNDIHSPQITVSESVIYSAWLRLPPEIDPDTKTEFVREVLETIELDRIKDALVGIPGVSGLSTEQRKRLTIAVELVSNPSIIFMDEPTSGLDARAAAIVMRAVKNVVDIGRTVVCTIHQPSIDIFEAFDELILMKKGGQIIYSGLLGEHSSKLIEYFECIPGLPKIKSNYNPATWMLEVTSTSVEAKLGIDFAHIYRTSPLCRESEELVEQLSKPPTGSRQLHFPSSFPRNWWGQFSACLWKQNLSYWRNPAYNLMRLMFTTILAVLFGLLLWQKGKKINDEQDLFSMVGITFVAIIFLGMNNCSTVLPCVATERTVLYREQFAGMYSSWAYSAALVTTEIPYLFLQAVIYVVITYPAIGYYWVAADVIKPKCQDSIHMRSFLLHPSQPLRRVFITSSGI
ncbi:ABC transporter-like [Macleaya cordata]|uniref:ABC transporter-like n=1 Tax=Macleaya cordata TaxID=56857 RepID=A0A200R1W7_MACCD|nr:ABC transporter-like [Macleaya cordata]